MTSQNVEVKLELGHRATLRDKKTAEGFTHDWTLFVRGPEGLNITHFVEKVVFFLHESFHKPKRVLKEPPYHVSESGYAGFNLAIEVHFRNKEDPKKVRFEYDLYLHLEGPPIQNSRLEKLTFQNPNQDFRKKVLKGGGVAVSGSSQSNNCSSSNPVQTETEEPPRPKPIKGSNEVPKKTPKTKLPHIVKEVLPPKVAEPTRQPFTDIFGTPIKTKPSPDTSHKSKDNAKEKSSSSKSTSSSTSTTLLPTGSSKSTSKEKTTSSSKEKHSKPVNKEAEKKENKTSSLKRSLSPIPIPPTQPSQQSHKVDDTVIKKRRRSTSTSSTTSSVTEKNSGTFKDVKKKPKEKEHKKEHKIIPPVANPSTKETMKQSKPQHVAPRKEPRDSKSPVPSGPHEDQENIASSGKVRKDSESSEGSVRSHEEKEIVKHQEDESQSSIGSASSPSSSLSLSSLPPGSTHGPLATMMAQMEQELVSPMSSEQATPIRSPIHSPMTPEEPVKEEIPPDSPSPASPVPVKKCKEKRHNEKTLTATKKMKESESSLLPPPAPHVKANGKQQQPIDAAYLRELMQLQERIMALRDKQHLQRIVNVIEETGLYSITSSTIDFDLCALDRSTVQKLQNCMAVT